jgi:alpha-amylase
LPEVYNYRISGGQDFDFGDKSQLFMNEQQYDQFRIQMECPRRDYEFIFSKYSNKMTVGLNFSAFLNYMSSHDDGAPFDAKRNKNRETGTKFITFAWVSQVYCEN